MTTPRLNQQLIDLQIEIDIATGKLHKIREALILETRIEEKLRIEYQIELTEQTLDQLNQRYDKLEEYLSNIGLKELPEADQNPYKSLAAFQEEDSEQFFGREVFVQELLQKYQQVKILPLLGPSGSGKSSVARAGLIPQLKQLDSKLQTIILTPTDVPLENLANHLAWLITQDPFPIAKTREFEEFLLKEKDALRRIVRNFISTTNQSLVILIDQFEEIYTLCKEKTLQTAFIENILTLNEEQHLSVKIILTLRSDFLGETQQHSKLNQLLAKDSVIVPAMNENELRDAISKPAELMKHPLDEATINLLLEQTEGRASALPLLQFALTQIWDNMSKGISAAQTLSECGGVGGALAKKAQQIFEKLPEEDQKVTRRIFLKLVQLGEGAKDTRRRTPLSEMIAQHDESSEKVKLILERFARQDVRLLSLATQTVENNCIFAEITHEALLDNWQLLQEWLKDGREAERFHRRVHEATQLWQLNQQPIGSLWRSPDLDLLATFYASHLEDMTALEIDFFNSSREQQQREINEKLKQQRRLKLLTTVALIIAIMAGFFYFQAEEHAKQAIQQTKIAEDQKKLALDSENKAKEQAHIAKENEERAKEQEVIAQNNAQQALQEKQNAIEQRNEALKTQSLFLADLSQQELKKGNTTIATLLALEALPNQEANNNINRPFVRQAADSLHSASTKFLPFKEKFVLDEKQSGTTKIILSPDRQQILTISSEKKKKIAKLWDKQATKELRIFENIENAIFSPNSQEILTISPEDNMAQLWDKQTTKELRIFQHEGINNAVFSPDGQEILTISFKKNTANLWDKQTSKKPQILQHEGINNGVFSPDGQEILTISSKDNTAQLWDKQTIKKLQVFNDVGNAIFSPDGQKIIMTSSKANQIELWDKKIITKEQISQDANDGIFGPNSQQIILMPFDDRIVTLWDMLMKQELQTFQQVRDAIFSPDSQDIFTVSSKKNITNFSLSIQEFLTIKKKGGIAQLWNKQSTKEPQIFQHEGIGIKKAIFSSDGQQILTISSENNNDMAKLWDKQATKEIQTFRNMEGIEFRSNGQQIFTGPYFEHHAPYNEGRLWDKQATKELKISEHVENAIFSPNSQEILTISSKKNIAQLWDIQTVKELQTFQHKNIRNAVFSPDGQYIITFSSKKDAGNIAKLWSKQFTKELRTFEGIESAIFSPNGQEILTISSKKKIAQLWDKQSTKELRTFNDVKNAIFSPNGQEIFTISSKKKIAQLWDKQATKEIRTFNDVKNAIFSPDGQEIFTISPNKIAKLWDKQATKELRTFEGIENAIFSPDGQHIITFSSKSFDSMAKLWDKQATKELQTFNDVGNAIFSPDGQKILMISTAVNWVELWDKQTMTKEQTFQGARGGVFSPNSQQILLLPLDDTIVTLWNISMKQELQTFEDTEHAVFSPDGQKILIRPYDGVKILKHFPSTQALINYAKEQLPLVFNEKEFHPRVLTCQERKRFFLSLPKECIDIEIYGSGITIEP